jgi:hypothetical protein
MRIELPRYRVNWMFSLTTAMALVSVLAFVIPASVQTAMSWWLRMWISVGVAAGAVASVHLPFLTGSLRALWRRARSYPDVVRRLDEVSAELILLKGPRALQILRVDRDPVGRTIHMILDVGPLNGVAEGEWLIVLDTVVCKQVGRARVARFHAGRCFADFTPSDAVLDGFLREHASVSHPEGMAAFRELDVQAAGRRLQQP